MSGYKIKSGDAKKGAGGELMLAQGEKSAMRKWVETPAVNADKKTHAHNYETLGYVVKGKATLHIDGEEVSLAAGDSWSVPAKTKHRYEILSDDFEAVEVTTPPAHKN